jgi:uncharacterized iron-regulated membrane protein
MLCLTGLPLIFHHEISEATSSNVPLPVMAPGTPAASLDAVVIAGQAKMSGKSLQFLSWDRDERDLVLLSFGEMPSSDPRKNRVLRVDARTAIVLDELDVQGGVVRFLLKLHTDMFLGLPGKLFLGAMGLLFVVAIVSGVVVYRPSMRKLGFGEVRFNRIGPIKWLDLHNLLGIVIAAWLLVVGTTGVINTLSDLFLQAWQSGQLVEMIGAQKATDVPAQLSSVEDAVAISRRAVPGMIPTVVAYPGTMFSSTGHYAVFMKGDTPLTSRLLQPALIDARTGQFADSRRMPWYVTLLFVSEPLHFGDYGGMPLKLLWAILDIITIVILGSGVYLWAKRRAFRRSTAIDRDRQDAQPIASLAEQQR